MTDFSTNCSICNKPLGEKYRFKESRVGIFRPVVEEGEIVCFAMGEGRLALCKSCTQSLYSWMNNRRKKHCTDSFIDQMKFVHGRVVNMNEETEDT